MAGIFANVESDITKLKQLKEQIDEVKKALKSIDVNTDIGKGMEAQLKGLLSQYDTLVNKIAEAEAKVKLSVANINKAMETISRQTPKTTGTKPSSKPETGDEDEARRAKIVEQAYKDLNSVIRENATEFDKQVTKWNEASNAIRIYGEEIKKIKAEQKSRGTDFTEVEAQRMGTLNAAIEANRQKRNEASREMRNQIKIYQAADGSLNQLRAQLEMLKRAYADMTDIGSDEAKQLLNTLQQTSAKVSEIEQSMGVYGRNVGNYASAFNGLGMSVQQIVRELPAATMGLNMFFLAISNNLPILTDEIKRAREANEQLKKSGQSTVPVWKQLVGSIFSWQTALMLAITAFSMYGKEIVSWVKNLFNAGNSLENLVDIQKEMNDVMSKGTKDAQGDVTRLKLLYNATQDVTRSTKERSAAVEELQKEYPDYFGNMSKEEILAGKAADSYTRLSQAIIASARARAAQDKMTENASKILDNEQKINEAYVRLESAEERLRKERDLLNRLSGNPEAYDFQAGIVRTMQSNVDKIYDEIASYRTAIRETDKLNRELAKNIDIESLVFNPSENDNKGKKKKTKSPFSRTELDYTKELEKRIKETEERTMEASLETYEMSAAEQSAMNRYLSEYGTFQQRRLAITQEYQQKIAAATTEGEKLTLQKQMEEALSDTNMDELKESINWELVFSDLENVSKQSLQKIKKQLSDFKDSAEYKEMTVDQKQVIDEALNNIQSAIIDKGGLLGDLPAQLEELRKAQEELNNAQDEYNRALAEGTDEQKKAATQKLNKAQQGVSNAQKNVEQSTKKTTDNFLTLADAITQLGGSSEMTLTQVGQLAGSIADSFAEAGSKIGGIIGAIFSLLDQIGKQGLDGFLENVFSSVGSALYGVFDTLLGWTGINFGGESDPHLEEDLERLAISNQELEKALNNLSEKMDESSVAEASDIYEVQKENIEKQMANTWESMWRSLNASSSGFMGIGGSHSTNYKINHGMTAEDWKAISDAVGKSVTDASDFFSLTSEEMWKAANGATTEYSKLKELADDGYKDAAQYMDDYIGYWQELEELQDEYNEKLTSVSFDTIQSDFRNAILGMTDDSEAFAENFEKLMQQAVLESMMTNTYDKQLRKWYESFSSYMEGGELTKGEQEALRKDWQDIVDKASEEWKMWQETMGWDTSSSAQQQQSSRGSGFETMTQDQASELSGRFTAVHEGELRIESAVGQQTLAITDIKGSI